MSEKIDEKVVKKRNYMVDLCRFIAALMIMLCHLDLIGLAQYPTYMFVDFFFILSGYFTLNHFAKMKSAKKAVSEVESLLFIRLKSLFHLFRI